jgi:hypothetical protein
MTRYRSLSSASHMIMTVTHGIARRINVGSSIPPSLNPINYRTTSHSPPIDITLSPTFPLHTCTRPLKPSNMIPTILLQQLFHSPKSLKRTLRIHKSSRRQDGRYNPRSTNHGVWTLLQFSDGLDGREIAAYAT